MIPIWFDGVCVLIALYLFSKAKPSMRSISFTMLCFFVVSEIIYQRFFLDFRTVNNWVIYWIYNAVSASCMWKFYQLKAHFLVFILMGLNIIVSSVASLWFVNEIIPKIVYNYYPYPAGAIMVLCLVYMWMLTNGNRFLDSKANNSSSIRFLFWRGRGDPDRYLS